MSDALQEPPVIEPVDPFERGVFDGIEGLPWSAPMNEFGLEQTDNRLGQCVVVTVANTADRGLQTRLGEALGIPDRDILAAAIGVMHEATSTYRPSGMNCLFQGI